MIHYNTDIMGAIASQITSLAIVYSIVYSDEDQRKHQSSASLAFVRGIHRGPVNFPYKWPLTRKMFPFDDVIMINEQQHTRPLLFGSGCRTKCSLLCITAIRYAHKQLNECSFLCYCINIIKMYEYKVQRVLSVLLTLIINTNLAGSETRQGDQWPYFDA